LEETGLSAIVGDLIGVFEIIRPPTEHRIIVYHWAAAVAGSLSPDDDLSDLKFVSRDEVGSLDLTEICREVLERAGWLTAPNLEQPPRQLSTV
jgi:ADP-ribose pyrophosphatase YjhB (NUDIX family)